MADLDAPTSMPKILSIDEWWAQHGAPAALDSAVGIGTDMTAGELHLTIHGGPSLEATIWTVSPRVVQSYYTMTKLPAK